MSDVANVFSSMSKYGNVVDWSDLDALVGRLLTHIDALMLDPIAREANKSIVKQIVREWMRDNDNQWLWGGLKFTAKGQENTTEMLYEVSRDTGMQPVPSR